MEAFKFLDKAGRTAMTEFRWPQPVGSVPGEWVQAPLVRACHSGIHACTADHLAYWISDRLWLIELDGEIEPARHKVVAPRGRLLRPIIEWEAGVRSALETDVTWRLRERVVSTLADAGQERWAAHLRAAASLAEMANLDEPDLDEGPLEPSMKTAILLLSDCAFAVENEAPASAPFVAACAAGHLASRGKHDQSAVDAAFHSERLRQSQWIARQLGLSS